MKNFLIVIIAALLVFGCSESDKTALTLVKLTGSVPDKEAKEIKLFKAMPYSYKYDEEPTVAGKIDKEGKFSLSFSAEKGWFYRLKFGENWTKYPVYLQPGDSLDIKIFEKENNIYSGRGKSVTGSKIYEQFNEAFQTDDNFRKNMYSSDYKEFLKFCDGWRYNRLQYYKKNINSGKIPDDIKGVILDDIDYGWAHYRIDHLLRFHYWNEEENKLKLDSNSMSFLAKININEPRTPLSAMFGSFVKRYLALLVADWYEKNEGKAKADDNLSRYKKKYELAKIMFQGTARNIAMKSSIEELLERASTKEEINLSKTWLGEFKKSVSDTNFTAPLSELYKKRLNLMPGNMAPDFTLPDNKDKQVSLSDFRGKVVYIDFWGTWCGPCLQELPYYQELQKKFAGRDDIVFMSLALESVGSADYWKNFIKERKLPGIQLYLDNGFSHEIAKEYMISGVPTFMMFDKEGKIITSNAMRPSDTKLVEYILKHLN